MRASGRGVMTSSSATIADIALVARRTMAMVSSFDTLRAPERPTDGNIEPPASPYAIMRRAYPYGGENSGPGKDIVGFLGEPETAIERFARAMRLSPLDPWVTRMRGGTAHAHFLLGRYDEAASWAATALQDNADYQPGLRIAAASNAMTGRPEQAHKALARLRQLNPALRVSTLKIVLGPHRRAEDLSRLEEGLRQARLPE